MEFVNNLGTDLADKISRCLLDMVVVLAELKMLQGPQLYFRPL